MVSFLHLLSFSFIFILFLLSSVDHDPTIHLVNRWGGGGLGRRDYTIGGREGGTADLQPAARPYHWRVEGPLTSDLHAYIYI